jgi:alpha-L-fucosidase
MTTKKTRYEERMKWFHKARFAMFIHWGLYSLLGRGEWAMLLERIRAGDYAKLADRFNPNKFDADAWAGLAAEAGMKYMVLTTRHHDGFCLFDSAVSDFTSVKTAARRDLVAEYARACRKAGLKVGFYYSLLDWRFPGYWDAKKHPESARAMVRQCHDQVRELMTQYGRVDYLFYDGEWVPGIELPREAEGKIISTQAAGFWESRKLNRMVRRLQPHMIINNRAAIPEDVDTPEQEVTASAAGRGWESCMTIGDAIGWGYVRHNPNWKTVPQLLQHLVTAAAGEGNLNLNVGPNPDGSIRREEVERLRAIGEWMTVHGESIYGSQRSELHGAMLGQWTRKGNIGYLHMFHYPGREAVVPLVATRVRSAELMGPGTKLHVRTEYNGRVVFSGMPARPPLPYMNTIKVRFAGEPRGVPWKRADRPAWLEGKIT